MKKVAKLLIPILVLCFVLFAFTACFGEMTTKQTTNKPGTTTSDENKPDTTKTDKDSTDGTTNEHSHTYGEWVTTKEPTCAETGLKSRTCTAGDDTQTEVIPATGLHTYGDDHVCTVCGQEQPAMTEGLVFTLKEDDTYEVTEYEGTEQDVHIGDTYEGKAVTSIGERAFSGCGNLTSITIPDSVTSIGYKAFYECFKLVEVYNKSSLNITKGSEDNGCVGYYAKAIYTAPYASKLSTDENGYILYTDGEEILLIGYTGTDNDLTLPEGITEINQGAFVECSSLTSIIIPNSVKSIGDESFVYCSSLTSITIPDSVISIGDSAFACCSSLTSMTIPDSVTNIGVGAFEECSSLTSITIPDSVTSIGDFAFWECFSLTSITIPDSVTNIGDGAFDGCISLTSITIPASVKCIGNSAFEGCDSLTRITIPNSVTSIGDFAFYGCSSLTSITIPDRETCSWGIEKEKPKQNLLFNTSAMVASLF